MSPLKNKGGRRMTATNQYLEYRNFLRKLAWSYNKTTGMPYEELFSEATVGYTIAMNTYSPEKKVPIINWIALCIKSRLNNFLRENRNNIPTTFLDEEMAENIPAPDEYEAKESLEQIMEILSADAREICQMIIDGSDVYGSMNGRKVRGKIRKELRRKEWAHNRIWKAFDEIKAVLK